MLFIGGSQSIRVVLNLATIAVLARFVTSEEFGLIAVLTTISLIANYFGEFGLSVSIIRHQGRGLKRVANLVFWWTLIFSSVIGLGLYLTSGLVGDVLKNDELTKIISIAALLYPIVAMRSAHKAFVERMLRFKLIAVIEVSGAVVSAVVATVLAVNGAGVWALLAQQYALSIFLAVAYFTFSGFRPSWPRDLLNVKELFSFGGQLTAYQLTSIVGNYSDRPIILRFQGAESLGYYSVGNQLIQFLVMHISSAVQRVMLPSMSSMRDDLGHMREAYCRVFYAVCLVMLPSMVGLSLVSEEFVLLFLGEDWKRTGEIVKWNALAGPFLAVNWLNYTILLILGRIRTQLIFGLVQATATIAAFLIGSAYSIELVVKLYFAVIFVFSIALYIFISKMLSIETMAQIKNIFILLLSVTAMTFSVLMLSRWVDGSTLFRFVCLVGVGGGVFMAIEFIFERRKLLGLIRAK